MALIVEDGSGVANANSYVSVVNYRTWATARGLSLPPETPEGDLSIEQAAIKVTDYLEIEFCYQGEQVEDDQSLSWPRVGVVLKGKDFAEDEIPKNLVTASYYLINAVLNGAELMPNVSGNATDYIKKEKVGPIETEYADPTQFDGKTTFTAVERLLESLLGSDCSGGFSFDVVRG